MPNPVVGLVGGSIVSGVIGSKGAKDASKSAAASEAAGIEFQRESRDLALGYQKPYRDAGYNALSALMDMAGLSRPPAPTQANPVATSGGVERIGFTMRNGRRAPVYGERKTIQPVPGGTPGDTTDLSKYPAYDWTENNPGYAFRLEEGQRATENMLRSAGMLNSGKALRAITRYGQDYASNEYDKAWARLSSIAGIGTSATSSGNASIGNAANAIQQGYSNIGGATAAGKVGQANAWGGAISDIAGAYGMYRGMGNPTQDYLNLANSSGVHNPGFP